MKLLVALVDYTEERMSVTADVASSWTLSDLARGQLRACGIALSEVYRVLRMPEIQLPTEQGGIRFTGYGLSVIVEDGTVVAAVEIDGATQENWQEWAVERAVFADSGVAAADELVEREVVGPLRTAAELDAPSPPRPRAQTKAPAARGLVRSHVLDAIHPALRDEITRQVDGDFSRLVVISSTRVEILPLG